MRTRHGGRRALVRQAGRQAGMDPGSPPHACSRSCSVYNTRPRPPPVEQQAELARGGRLPDPAPRTDWSQDGEADDFARTVKLFRQGWYDADSFRRFRLQNGAYGTRMTGDYAMVRIKVPAGEFYPRQMERIAQLCEAYSIGSAHLSTRENVQLHWVVLEDVSEVMRGLAEVGMTTREACGNTVRNVMCSPLSGVCPREAFDATPYALATARFFLRNPMNQNLPRKFKFNFTCCEEHGMARMVDVGLVPCTEGEPGAPPRRGFRVFLGGGLGNRSFVGHQLEDFTPEGSLLHTSLAVLRIFDRLGDRRNMARNRMRYLVNEMGWEAFRDLVLKERAVMRATQAPGVLLDLDLEERPLRGPAVRIEAEGGPDAAAAAPPPGGFLRWRRTNTVGQRQDGYSSAFVTLEAGDITAGQLRALAAACRDFSGEGMARNGFAQDVVIRHVRNGDLEGLYARLAGAGLASPGALTMASPVGCSGTTSCNLALTNSHRLAKEIQRRFLEEGLDEDDDLAGSTIKISGCPNSCGQHGIATVGFYGGGSKSGGRMYPVYQMSVGGRHDGETALGVNCMRVPAKRVIPALMRIIGLFREEKAAGAESAPQTLKAWAHAVAAGAGAGPVGTVADLRARLAEFAEPPEFGDDPGFFADYGSDASYRARTGKGECAA